VERGVGRNAGVDECFDDAGCVRLHAGEHVLVVEQDDGLSTR
jgi:hypothetical protein